MTMSNVIKFIYVMNPSRANFLCEQGFSYTKSLVNNKEVCVFEYTSDIEPFLSKIFINGEYFISDKILF